VQVAFEYTPDGGSKRESILRRSFSRGEGRLSVNGGDAVKTHFESFGGFYRETFDVGDDLGSPVSDDYVVPFSFSGKVETVSLELDPK